MRPLRAPAFSAIPTAWILAISLLLPSFLSAAACKGEDCPSTGVDWIFYNYAKHCAGMDWRALRAVAKAESGLDSNKRESGRVGLFQLDQKTCNKNIGGFSSFLSCSKLEDPEVNTAAALNRLHRLLSEKPGIIAACPGNSSLENLLLAYIGMEHGPDMLRHVLENKACRDAGIREAIYSYYKAGKADQQVISLIRYEGLLEFFDGIKFPENLYIKSAADKALCPSATGKRVFSKSELKLLHQGGGFKDKPLFDPETSARLAAGARLGESWEKAFTARLARMAPGWERSGGPGDMTDGGLRGEQTGEGGGALAPTAQLPRRFRVKADSPPPPKSAVTLPGVVDLPVEAKPVGLKLTGPKALKNFKFQGEVAEAQAWTATYADGTTFAIIAPKVRRPGFVYHTVKQAADAARYLHKDSRAEIKVIILNRIMSPDDAYWAKEFKIENFHSYMSAARNGIVTIYPDDDAMPGDNFMRGTMIHEIGHLWSTKKWGDDTKKGTWVVWKVKMDADKTWVSIYAKSSLDEDLAETFQVYGSVFGGKNFNVYRRKVPNRFAMLAKELK